MVTSNSDKDKKSSLLKYSKIETRADYQLAIDKLLTHCEQELRIFDRDMAELNFNSIARIESLRSFLLKGRNNRLYIALHEIDYLTKYCARLLTLLKQFSHAIFVKQTNEEIRHLQDCFIIVDRSHYLRRPSYLQPRAFLGMNDLNETQALYDRFNEIWAMSTPSAAATTLGL